MTERLTSDPLDEVGLTPALKNIVVNALKRGRNGSGYEQGVRWSQGEAVLSPEQQEPLRQAVEHGDTRGIVIELRDAIIDNTNREGREG